MFTCTADRPTITAAVVAGAIGIGLPLEGAIQFSSLRRLRPEVPFPLAWTGFTMYRNWDVFRRLGQRRVFLTVYVRLTLSTICAVLAFTFVHILISIYQSGAYADSRLSTLAFSLTESNETSLCYPIGGHYYH